MCSWDIQCSLVKRGTTWPRCFMVSDELLAWSGEALSGRQEGPTGLCRSCLSQTKQRENALCHTTFTSFTGLTRVMMGSIFRSVRLFSASSSELRPVVTGSCHFISTSCGHTHPVSEDASETTTTILNRNRGAHTVEYTHVTPLHERIWSHLVVTCFFLSRQRCLDSFHPRVLIVKTVAPE